MQTLFVCTNKDGSPDSFVFKRGGGIVWAGRPDSASGSFLDDYGSAEMTMQLDVRHLVSMYETMRGGRSPDVPVPTAVVVFPGRRYATKQKWDMAFRDAGKVLGSPEDMADWADRQGAGSFTKGQGRAYVYDFGNANKTSRYDSAVSYTRVRDGYTFVCNIFGYHLLVICHASADASTTYEVHVLDENNVSRGSVTTKDLETFCTSLMQVDGQGNPIRSGYMRARMLRFFISSPSVRDVSWGGRPGFEDRGPDADEWRSIYKMDTEGRGEQMCSYHVRSWGAEPIRAAFIGNGFCKYWVVDGFALDWIVQNMRFEVLVHVDTAHAVSYSVRFVCRVDSQKETKRGKPAEWSRDETWDDAVRGACAHLRLSERAVSSITSFKSSPFWSSPLRRLLKDRALGKDEGSPEVLSPPPQKRSRMEGSSSAAADARDAAEREYMLEFLDGVLDEEEEGMTSFPIGPLEHEYEDEEWIEEEGDEAAVEDLMTFPSGPWGAKEEEEYMMKYLDEIEGRVEQERGEDEGDRGEEMIDFPPAPSDSEVFQGGSLWAESTTRGLGWYGV